MYDNERFSINDNDWVFTRTCSRVSAGICDTCKSQCYFGGWHRKNIVKPNILCQDCYQKEFQPEAYIAHLNEIKKAEEERQRLVANPPPGSITTENGGLFGPVQKLYTGNFCLGEYRQVLKGGLYDTTPIKSSKKQTNINFFKSSK